MAFQPRFLLPNWKHVTSGANLFNKPTINICRRHLNLLSTLNHNSVHSHWSRNSHNVMCKCESCQNKRNLNDKKISVINYNTLCSQHRTQVLNRLSYNSALIPHNVSQLQNHRCLSTTDLISACPPKYQPYLRLIRFDKPIGICTFYHNLI